MKKIFAVFISVLALSFICCIKENNANETAGNLNSDGSLNLNNFTLTFKDDFEGTKLNLKKWRYSPEMVRQGEKGWGGIWKKKCSSVENGNYVCTCTIDDDRKTPISGAIQTNGKFEQQFGLFHIRFKVEKAYGLWYAFWLLNEGMENDKEGNPTAKDGAELDIFEIVPGADRENDCADFGMSVHWGGYEEDKETGKPKTQSKSDFTHHLYGDFYKDYHEVWYLWDKDGYKFFMDGTDKSHMIFNFPAEEYGKEVCQVPSYMIISAEYGVWGGEIDPSMLPAHFYVDYVEVYKEK